MKKLLCCFLLLMFLGSVNLVFADEVKEKKETKKKSEVKFTVGSWDESNKTLSKSTDFTFIYYSLSYKDATARFDLFNTNRRRYWFNYKKISLINDPSFKLSYTPGVMLNNQVVRNNEQNQFFYGGFLNFNFPKLGLNTLYKCYGGEKIDFHQVFSDLKVSKNFDISHYLFTNAVTIPDSYIGPKLKFNVAENGIFHVWYGFSLTSQKPDAKLLNIGCSFDF